VETYPLGFNVPKEKEAIYWASQKSFEPEFLITATPIVSFVLLFSDV
jgi:hypothetical protein